MPARIPIAFLLRKRDAAGVGRVRLRDEQRESNRRTPGRPGIWTAVLALLLVATVVPVSGVAQDDGAAESETASSSETVESSALPSGAPAPAEVVIVPPSPTAVPTLPPPTAVPPTAVPPTAVPPTQIPPTAVPPTETPVPMATTAPTPTPTERVWVNSDAIRLTDGVTIFTLGQGETATIPITYNVTTPRSSTNVYAALAGQVDGWSITSPDLADNDPAEPTAIWIQTSTTQPESSFTLRVMVTAPESNTADHNVTLRFWSTAEGTNGQENGVAKTDRDVASFAVIAPTPTPTVEAKPTDQTGTTLTRMSLTANVTPPSGMPDAGTCSQPTEDGNGGYKVICAFPQGKTGPVAMSVLQVEGAKTCTILEQNNSNCATVQVISGIGNSGTNAPTWLTLAFTTDVIGDFFIKFTLGFLPAVTYSVGTEPTADPDLANLSLDCSPSVAVPWGEGTSAEATCTIAATTDLALSVTVSSVNVAVPSGMSLTLGEIAPDATGSISLTGVTLAAGESRQLSFSVARTACITEAAEIAVATTITWTGGPANGTQGPTSSISTTFAHLPQPVSLSMAGFAFAPLTWTGEAWGTTTGTGTITVSREGCGNIGSATIQVRVSDRTNAGLRPQIQSVSVPEGSSIVAFSGPFADPNTDDPNAAVSIASVPTDFGSGAQASSPVDVTFALTPDNDVPAGEHTMTIEVTTVVGQ